MSLLKQIIKEELKVNFKTITEFIFNVNKRWIQQMQGMNISGHIWLSQEELLKELKRMMK